MATQAFSPSAYSNQAELQHEIERLFGEIERILDHSAALQQPLLNPIHWAYMPPDEEDTRATGKTLPN